MSFMGLHFGNGHTKKRGVPAVIFFPQELIVPVKHTLQQEERYPTMSDLKTGWALIGHYLKKTPQTDAVTNAKASYAGHAFTTMASRLDRYLHDDGRLVLRKSRWDELVSFIPVIESSIAAYKKVHQPQEEQEGVTDLAAFRAASKMPLMARASADNATAIRNLEAFIPAFRKLDEFANPRALPAPPTPRALFWQA